MKQIQWNHVVFTEDKNGLRKIYINGDFDSQGQYEAGIDTSDKNLEIGTQSTSSYEYRNFNGYIAKARVYNRALNEKEIKILYQKESKDAKQRIMQKKDGLVYIKEELKETL